MLIICYYIGVFEYVSISFFTPVVGTRIGIVTTSSTLKISTASVATEKYKSIQKNKFNKA